MLTKTKVFLTVSGLGLMVLAAIAASPVSAKFVPVPNPEPIGTGGTGSR